MCGMQPATTCTALLACSQASVSQLESQQAMLLAEKKELLGRLESLGPPRAVMDTNTPAQVLLDLLGSTLDASRPAPPASQLLRLREVLLRGVDVYQPEDLADKLVAASAAETEDVRRNLAVMLTGRIGGKAGSSRGTVNYAKRAQRGRHSCGGRAMSILTLQSSGALSKASLDSAAMSFNEYAASEHGSHRSRASSNGGSRRTGPISKSAQVSLTDILLHLLTWKTESSSSSTAHESYGELGYGLAMLE
jgi:hypothetical protein